MNKQVMKLCGGAVLLATLGLSASLSLAQSKSVSDVLNDARAAREAEQALYKKRAAEYNAMSDSDKQRAMQQANANKAAAQQQADARNRKYSENDLEISKLNSQLRDAGKGNGLNEVFGIAKQVSGDFVINLKQSLVSAQYANEPKSRVQALTEIANADKVLTGAQLERLAFEMQRELAASGEVVTYPGTVVQANGVPLSTDITRVGAFTAVADGKFLSYIPTLSRLSMLRRQPPEAELMRDAKALQSASSGYVEAVVDGSRGVLMNMYVERPTLGERIDKGQEVGYVIITVGLLGVAAFLFQLAYLIMARMGVSAQMRDLRHPKKNNPLGRVLLSFKGDGAKIEENAEVAELRISEAVMREVPKLERFQPFLRLAVAAGPLLGLVGTVWGMILTFQSITESGSSDPKLMAGGIGQAMIATVLGLSVAVPLLFANALLSSLSRSIVQLLDEQSTGMLAENIEKRKNA
ncbi:MAG TPA: MotA/TolQ/ExbB proton channel family protein [Candidatus Acidoferrum sp.]|nr:MotA/TolQ/ExbB proton channel family protein [Candidatus Acidoferrum sp.]